MKAFWITIISFIVTLTATCFWFIYRSKLQAELDFKNFAYVEQKSVKSKDTAFYCRVKCTRTDLVCVFNKKGEIIDTFTEVPMFDSLLINHSKIP